MALLAALLLPAPVAPAQPGPPGDRAGDRYELVRRYESSSESSEGATGSSGGHDMLVERVVAVRADGLELEYRLPEDSPAQSRESQWQFPARVLRLSDGKLQLLNRAELEARVERWLKKGKMTRDACGRWIFTWNAFRIDCDPETVIPLVRSWDLRSPELREGALHREEEALAPAPLTLQPDGLEGPVFVARMEIDPAAVRRGRAESDVAVGEMTGKAVTLEAAEAERAKEAVSGTITVTFAADPAGRVKRRTKVVELEIRKPGGATETERMTETLERLPAAAPSAGRQSAE